MDVESLGALGEVTEEQLLRLYTASLWNWQICAACSSGKVLPCGSCPARRAKQLSSFNDFYRTATSRHLSEFTASKELALRGHEDLIEIIRYLKERPSIPRQQLTADFFSDRAKREGSQEQPNTNDQDRAFDLATRILIMVNCSTELNQFEALLEEGSRLITWAKSDSLAKFVSNTFPTTNHPTLNDPNQRAKSNALKLSLQARRLTKIAGLTFRPTDNLADHLRLDPKEGTVEIFHHTRALEEFLIATQNENPTSNHPLPLPRPLALETIDTIQKILFPIGSPSEPLLRTLIVKHGFDPDCLRLVDPAPYRRPRENENVDMPYLHFGSRLMDLAHEVQHPAPRGTMERWLERRSGARYVMFATLAGVGVAVMLGFLALGVSIFQGVGFVAGVEVSGGGGVD
ncbi:hypothetical protein QBC34DRAFT_378787 [Podospora aff. communis PSN243]|uniref:Uncharacterized protein n=1 Tax=Podospora aff. communis PSN243 TaxID=3040156 RepID=A0AAV9GRV3_9PEZI|nr:hypothetical protein QBC34DRAFT_378787 [Podospora aff. communis PSN243]